jgi:beta-glucosidase
MVPYKDAQNHVYDFGFGLNWKGIIQDARTNKYKVKK